MRESLGVAAIIVEEDDSDTGSQPAAPLIGLPDELAEWVEQNRELVTRVQLALTSSYANLTEEQIWEVIATACDPDPPQWKNAREGLRSAQEKWDDLNHPINASLGAIGRALDSDETADASEHLAVSLSQFTIINEGLAQRKDLSTLLNVLLVQKRMVDQSATLTRRIKEAARHLTDMFSLKEVFGKAARKPSLIQRQFRAAKRLLAPRKQFNATGLTVPWSPGT